VAHAGAVRLSNRTAIYFRPIQPDDGAKLANAFEQLSAQSRYRRFLAPVQALSDEQLRAFTHVDDVNHVAWVAELSDHPDRPMVGVGRWIRSAVERYQRRGIGRALLELLAQSAETRGVRDLHASVLAENQPMRALLRSYGARQVGLDVGVYEYRLPVRGVLEEAAA
jgi:RimJ/RimL family protein N-acetyltransferase